MTPLELTTAIFGSMLFFMAVRFPIAISMFLAGAIGYISQAGWLPFANFVNAQTFARFAGYDLSVIPLFILMGNFATKGGISKSLFAFAASVMGGFKGGLAMASLLACACAAIVFVGSGGAGTEGDFLPIQSSMAASQPLTFAFQHAEDDSVGFAVIAST